MRIVVRAVFFECRKVALRQKKIDQRDLLDFKYFCAPCVGALK